MSQEMSAIAAINFSYYNPALAYTFATSSFSSNGGGGGCGTSTSPSSTSTSPLSTASSSSPCSSLPVSTNIHQHHHHQQHHHNTQQHQQLLSALSTAGASATSAAFNSPLINQNLISFPSKSPSCSILKWYFTKYAYLLLFKYRCFWIKWMWRRRRRRRVEQPVGGERLRSALQA